MKITKDNIVLELAVEQLRRIGFEGDPYEEVKKPGWWGKHRWPDKKTADEFEAYAKKEISRVLKRPTKRTLDWEWGMWNVAYGLRDAENKARR